MFPDPRISGPRAARVAGGWPPKRRCGGSAGRCEPRGRGGLTPALYPARISTLHLRLGGRIFALGTRPAQRPHSGAGRGVGVVSPPGGVKADTGAHGAGQGGPRGFGLAGIGKGRTVDRRGLCYRVFLFKKSVGKPVAPRPAPPLPAAFPGCCRGSAPCVPGAW